MKIIIGTISEDYFDLRSGKLFNEYDVIIGISIFDEVAVIDGDFEIVSMIPLDNILIYEEKIFKGMEEFEIGLN